MNNCSLLIEDQNGFFEDRKPQLRLLFPNPSLAQLDNLKMPVSNSITERSAENDQSSALLTELSNSGVTQNFDQYQEITKNLYMLSPLTGVCLPLDEAEESKTPDASSLMLEPLNIQDQAQQFFYEKP